MKIFIIVIILSSFCACQPGIKKINNPNLSEEKLSPQKPRIEKIVVKFNPPEEGITISELFKNKNDYEGKTVKIQGIVARYNAEIMNKNWIHLQDGTEYNGNFDLTITTNIETKKGDTLCFEGKIALDKDFGYGYYYEIIMEEAILCYEK